MNLCLDKGLRATPRHLRAVPGGVRLHARFAMIFEGR